MKINFSSFLNTNTLIFFGIFFILFIIFCILLFLVIRVIFRFIKSLFKKESKEYEMKDAMSDKGEDLEINVEQLERSKEERAKIQQQKGATTTYNQPIASKETKEPQTSTEAQQWSDKEKQDIEAGLGKLKGEEGAGEKKSFLERQSMGADSVAKPKINIPVSKKSSGQEAGEKTT
jgi:biopolymer transport protein ExbB/TolQ